MKAGLVVKTIPKTTTTTTTIKKVYVHTFAW
jgi:hypothetical protein